jgi:hypothetical protein
MYNKILIGIRINHWKHKPACGRQVSLFGNFLEVAKLLANQMLEDEVKEKAGLRYDREKPSSGR